MSQHILVVDDEESIRYTFQEFLTDAGYQVDTADSLIEAAAKVGDVDYDAIFLDILLGRESGMKLLKVMHAESPNCPVTMITGSPEIKTAAEAVRHGAFDYLTKPIGQEDLIRQAQRAVAYKTALDQKEQYQKRLAAVFQGVREGILVFDAQLTLIDMNFSAQQMLHCDEGSFNKSLNVLIEETDNQILKALRELLESRFDGELYKLKVPDAGGDELVLSISISPLLSATGQDTDLVLVLRNDSMYAQHVVTTE